MSADAKNKLTEEDKQRRREAVKSSLANHAIEKIYPTVKVTEVLNKYIEGDYDMDDMIDILVHDKSKD